jgi:hypothetical protein
MDTLIPLVEAGPHGPIPALRWATPALLALLAGTALLYLWGLGASGWANSFYSAAVQAGTKSWKAFFFGSSDAANFITVDKPPAVLWAMELSAARWAGDGITANALNPGAIETNLQRYVDGRLATPPERRKTTRQGAATTVLLATSPLMDGIGGRYFNDCNEGVVVDHRPSASGKRRSASSPDSTIYKPARCGRLRPGGDVIGNLAGSSVRRMARHP